MTDVKPAGGDNIPDCRTPHPLHAARREFSGTAPRRLMTYYPRHQYLAGRHLDRLMPTRDSSPTPWSAVKRSLANLRYSSTVGSGLIMSHQSGRPGSSVCSTNPAETTA